ncbi:MAG: hypothetical protein GY952_15860 [Rhodobacteraceae bacterium]|nr:hypothetical protein [Paracoccaceae bacterium]
MTELKKNFTAFGLYEYGQSPGTLTAKWVWSCQEHSDICQGEAFNGPATGFAGQYSVVYSDNTDTTGEPFDLIITAEENVYRLSWERDGTTIYHGIGFLVSGKLAFGWGPV